MYRKLPMRKINEAAFFARHSTERVWIALPSKLHERHSLVQMEKQMLSEEHWSARSRKVVKPHHYCIVRKEGEKLLWLEDVTDLDSAESRIRELTSFWPGEFQVMDQQNHQLVAFWPSSGSGEPSASCSAMRPWPLPASNRAMS